MIYWADFPSKGKEISNITINGALTLQLILFWRSEICVRMFDVYYVLII